MNHPQPTKPLLAVIRCQFVQPIHSRGKVSESLFKAIATRYYVVTSSTCRDITLQTLRVDLRESQVESAAGWGLDGQDAGKVPDTIRYRFNIAEILDMAFSCDGFAVMAAVCFTLQPQY